jgi:hypothetical protein
MCNAAFASKQTFQQNILIWNWFPLLNVQALFHVADLLQIVILLFIVFDPAILKSSYRVILHSEGYFDQ